VPPGLEHLWDGKKEFRLGATLAEAGPVWSARVQPVRDVATIGQLLDAFDSLYIPTLSPKTQAGYRQSIRGGKDHGGLRRVFGHMMLAALEPHHIYKYVDARGALTAAHREIEVLGSAYTFAISKGWINYHPIKGKVRLANPPKRTRYIENSELLIFKGAAPAAIFAYTWLRELTGLRRTDLLRIEPARHFTDEGIRLQPRKTAKTTGKRLLIEWTDELRMAAALAMAARPKDIAPWLFCTRQGACYLKDDGSANGWDSLWQRAMVKAMRAGLQERFTDRDIRKKVASDAPTLERAAALLGHADQRTTAKHYRIGYERVKPTR
jgi:integrase